MSDQETMDRVFSDMIATGRGGVVVSIPNRAGKSTIHRQMQQTKTNNSWFKPIESRYGISVDEAESLRAVFDKNMKESIAK